MKKSEIFWQTYLNLEKELIEVAKYIYITDSVTKYENGNMVTIPCSNQLQTFSPFIADLLIRVCIEIEAISKELYFSFGGSKSRGDSTLLFDVDCLKLIDIKCKTHEKVVIISCPLFNLVEDKNKIFKPLREAHKKQGRDWEKAYQALKHDRYSSLSQGNIKNLLHAMGALYLLNIYHRDVRLSAKYLEVGNLDFSLGSSVFSVKRPDEKYIIDIVNGQDIDGFLDSGESPFVLKYVDSSYKHILDANQSMVNAMQAYLRNQPEFNEPEFIQQLIRAKEREQKDVHSRCMEFWELCQYRLNKKLPSSLSFEERKRLFVDSSEWHGRLRQNNNHLNEAELTKDNIQTEIDEAGMYAGMELQLKFENIRMIQAFNKGYCELILDKGNVRVIPHKKN